MNVLITGVTGVLGGHLRNAFGERGISCLGLGRQDGPGVVAYERFFAEPRRYGEGALIFHLAFSRTSEMEELTRSYALARQLGEAAVKAHAAAIVHCSSQSVYDPQRTTPAREWDLPAPAGAYGLVKLACERLFDLLPLPVLHLRLGALLDPAFEKRLPYRLLESALAGAVEAKTGSERLAFLSAHDAAQSLSRLTDCSFESLPPVMNLGSGNSFSVADLVEIALKTARQRGIEPRVSLTSTSGGASTELDTGLWERHVGSVPCCDMARELERYLEERKK